ncbi:MAG: hypothetical protein EOO68_08365, partial [Moraxellaceae bacterium]
MRTTIPLQIIDMQSDGYHPLIDVTLFGKTFKLVLDTGASKTAFDKTLLEEANADALISDSEQLSTGLGNNTMTSYTAIISDLCLGDLQIAEFEVAVLDLVISHDDRLTLVARQRVGEIPGGDVGLRRLDVDLEAVERIVRRIGVDHRIDAGKAVERRLPEIERRALARPDARVVARLPGFERRDRADDPLLADLHAAADAAVLE